MGKAQPARKFAPQRHLASSAAPRPAHSPYKAAKGRGFAKGGNTKGKGHAKGKGGRGKGQHRPIHSLEADLDDSVWYEEDISNLYDDYTPDDYDSYEDYDDYSVHTEEYGFEEAYVLDDAYTPHDLDPGHAVAVEGSPDLAEA